MGSQARYIEFKQRPLFRRVQNSGSVILTCGVGGGSVTFVETVIEREGEHELRDDEFWERQKILLNHRAQELQTGLANLAEIASSSSQTLAKIEAGEKDLHLLEAARDKERKDIKKQYGIIGKYNLITWGLVWFLTFVSFQSGINVIMFWLLGLLATGYFLFKKYDLMKKSTLDGQIANCTAPLMDLYGELAGLNGQYSVLETELSRKENYLNQDIVLLAQAEHAVSPSEWIAEVRLREEARTSQEREERRLQMEQENERQRREEAQARLNLEERRLQMEQELGERRLRQNQDIEERRLNLQGKQVELQGKQVEEYLRRGESR